jgi:hypothetical protein
MRRIAFRHPHNKTVALEFVDQGEDARIRAFGIDLEHVLEALTDGGES